MNTNILAVNIKTLSTYDFLQDGETQEELLNRANNYNNKEIKCYKEIINTKPQSNSDGFFTKQLEQAEQAIYKVITWDEFEALQRSKYITNEDLTEITNEHFEEMLDVLPPLQWCTINNVEMFCMREMHTGTYTTQYAHDKTNGKYYSKMVDITDQVTWINNYIKR